MSARWLGCVVTACVIVAAGGVWVVVKMTGPAAWNEGDILEMVVREYVGKGEPGQTVFLEAGADEFRDPSPSFLARFRDLPVTFRPASQAGYRGAGYTVVDTKTHKDSYILSVGRIRRVSNRELEVRVQDYAADLDEWGGVYRLCYVSGAWKIVEKRQLW